MVGDPRDARRRDRDDRDPLGLARYHLRMPRDRGFTLIELLLVLAVAAILALLAIPSMQEGALRKQVKEGLGLADIAKAGVQGAWSATGELPADNKAAGLPEPEKIVGSLVAAVRVDHGAVTLTFGNNASRMLAGKKITLRPAVVPDELIVPIAWLCHAVNVPKGMEVRGRDDTDLSPDVLPVECRASPP
jgi:type IV pilus assembly protein PilA